METTVVGLRRNKRTRNASGPEPNNLDFEYVVVGRGEESLLYVI